VDDTTANTAIQNSAGTDALSLPTTQLATNSSTVDTTNPTVVSGQVDPSGTSITLTFSEPMSSTTAAGGRFTLAPGSS
jgi:hypothetical protein